MAAAASVRGCVQEVYVCGLVTEVCVRAASPCKQSVRLMLCSLTPNPDPKAPCGVQEVYVCGLVTEVCVRAAALDAARERFATYLVVDASGALEKSPGDEARVREELRGAGVTTVTAADLLAGRPEAS